MSPQHISPLRNGATDVDSDSDYLGTPVDPPASCQPYVAEYAPLTNYYYSTEAYGGAEYAVGRSGDHLGLPGSSEYGGPSPHQGLLLQTPYPVTAPDGCSQQPADTTIAAYPLITPSLLPPSTIDVESTVHISRSVLANSRDSSFTPASQVDSPRTHYGTPTMRYMKREADDVLCASKDAYMSVYSRETSQQSDDAGNAPLPYPLLPYSLDASARASGMPYASGVCHDDSFTESPDEESAYCDRTSAQACDYSQRLSYYQDRTQLALDTPTHVGYSLSKAQHIRFYQPPSCPYSYPHVQSSGSAYGSHSLSASLRRSGYIHAPRPQQVHDIHNLHNSTCPSDDMLPPHHRVLSIPSIPAPPSIPRPSSLIEDSPKKPLTLACFFCRKRKIACQSPPAGSLDRSCNQCSKRKLKCVYPATSRRGIRPRVYDLTDDLFRRPSVSVSL